MTTFNKQQNRFLTSKAKNILVSAGAGSGKTTTMIEKLKDLVTNGVDLDDIMVVTYTRSAAAEMKQKLKTKLSQLASIESDPENIVDQIDKINNADIGTFHAFCYKYIIKYFYKLDIDPNARIIEDPQSIFEKSFKNVVKTININNQTQYFELFELFNSKRNYDELYDVTRNVYDFLQSLFDAPSYIQKVCNLDADFYLNYMYKYYLRTFNTFNNECEQLIKEAQINDYDKFVNYFKTINSFYVQFLNAGDVYKALDVLFNFTYPAKPRSTKNNAYKAFCDDVELSCDKFKKNFEKAKKNFITNDKSKILLQHTKYLSILHSLLDFVQLVNNEYKRLKRDQNVLDFGDLEDLMIELISDPTNSELLHRFKYVFVDEYQDINEKQDYVITKLSTYNEYLIGDVKQSIYAFRLCKPQILLDKYNEWSKDASKEVIDFTYNYRSNIKILDFANMIFDRLITTDTVGIDYKNRAQLETTTKFLQQPVTPVKMLLLDKDAHPELTDAQQYQQAEAELIVKEIDNIINKEYYNPETNSCKTITFDDIAILVRDRSEIVTKLFYMLKNDNIPVNAVIKSTIFDSYEVNLLYNYIKLINNQLDDVALCSALLSKMCGLTNDDIASLRINSPEEKYFYNIALNSDNAKIKQFLEELERFRQMYYVSDIYTTLKQVYNYYDLDNFFKSFVDGDTKLSHIDIFFTLLEKVRDNNLKDVIDYFETYKTQKQDINIGNGGITITTIHDSKGLEYPVVFLAELDKGFVRKSLVGNVVMSMETGVGIKSIDIDTKTVTDSIAHQASVISKFKEEFDEKIRLLYVGITRAKNVLRLTGKFQSSKLMSKYVYSCNSFLELIMSVLPNSVLEAIKLGKQTLEYDDYVIELPQLSTPEDNVKQTTMITDTDFKLLDAATKFSYPQKAGISLKASVSSLMEDNDYLLQTDGPTNFTMSDQVTAAQKGNSYHKIMEKLNFNLNSISKNDIDEIVSIYQLDSSLINYEEIIKAFDVIKPIVCDKKYDREVEFMTYDNYNHLVIGSKEDQKILVQGVCDLVVFDKDCITLIDYKTNNYRYEQQFVDKYKLQLSIYAKALQEAYKVKKVEKYIYSFKLKKLIKFE